MELTQKKAVTLQRRLWEDMRNRLGDNPGKDERYKFAEEWCEKHFPNEEIYLNCFLCEYDDAHGSECTRCRLHGRQTKANQTNPRAAVSLILQTAGRCISMRLQYPNCWLYPKGIFP